MQTKQADMSVTRAINFIHRFYPMAPDNSFLFSFFKEFLKMIVSYSDCILQHQSRRIRKNKITLKCPFVVKEELYSLSPKILMLQTLALLGYKPENLSKKLKI